MTFHPNGAFLYIIVGIIIVFVLAQSVYFLLRAWKRAKVLGIEPSTLKKTVATSAVFTIAPAVGILLGVITLSKFLGFPLPWLRLSVIGALTYELAAATTAANAVGASIAETVTDPKTFSAIAWVMTLGIMPSLIYVAFGLKKIQSGVIKIKESNKAWGDIFMTALFLGMISAFLGMIFATVSEGLVGWIPVFVMLASAALMSICGLLVKLFKLKWVEDFALPISMLGAMALSIPITSLVTAIA